MHNDMTSSYNEQESLIELIMEKLLVYEDAIAAYNDAESDELFQKPTITVEWNLPQHGLVLNTTMLVTSERCQFPINNHLYAPASL